MGRTLKRLVLVVLNVKMANTKRQGHEQVYCYRVGELTGVSEET